MPATLATVEAYITAAQAAFNDSDYDETRKQIILADMELAKLPSSSTDQGASFQLRSSLDKIRDAVTSYEDMKAGGTGRSYMGER